jgi:hypothetical protein
MGSREYRHKVSTPGRLAEARVIERDIVRFGGGLRTNISLAFHMLEQSYENAEVFHKNIWTLSNIDSVNIRIIQT